MADQTLSATEWLYSKRSELDAKFLEFNWATPWGLSLFDFEVSLMGGEHRGRGTDPIQNTAMAKAVSEAIERLVCAKLQISTQGVAAHPIEIEAKINAIREGLERALFKYHLENEIAFSESNSCPEVAAMMNSIQEIGQGSVFLRKMIPVSGYESSVCIIEKDNQHFLGLGLNKNTILAQSASIIEALRNFGVYLKNPDKFTSAVKNDPNLWSCDPKFFDSHKSVFSKVVDHKLSFKYFFSPVEILNKKIEMDLPVFVARAEVSLGDLL